MIQKAKSWDSALRLYKSLNDEKYEPYIHFINGVINSQYSWGLYPYTSHETLRIAQKGEISDKDAHLEIQPLTNSKKAIFRYKGDNTLKYTWQKEVNENKLFTELERFLKELKWVVDVG